MNWHCTQLQLKPPVLDIGSGAFGTASYQRYIPNYEDMNILTVDISPERKPSKVADVQMGIPFDDAWFNTCLAFNVFEYFYHYEAVIKQIWRVLAPGGMLYIAVPFLDRVHSDPGDALRYTAFSLEKMLMTNHFDRIKITPYGTGAAAAALDMLEFAVPRPLRGIAFRTAVTLDRFFTRRSGGKYRNANDYPLGYFVSARKQEK